MTGTRNGETTGSGEFGEVLLPSRIVVAQGVLSRDQASFEEDFENLLSRHPEIGMLYLNTNNVSSAVLLQQAGEVLSSHRLRVEGRNRSDLFFSSDLLDEVVTSAGHRFFDQCSEVPNSGIIDSTIWFNDGSQLTLVHFTDKSRNIDQRFAQQKGLQQLLRRTTGELIVAGDINEEYAKRLEKDLGIAPLALDDGRFVGRSIGLAPTNEGSMDLPSGRYDVFAVRDEGTMPEDPDVKMTVSVDPDKCAKSRTCDQFPGR